MHYHVGKLDPSRFTEPELYAGHCDGFDRVSLINRTVGSVHAEACISRLASGGHIAACVHAFEKGIYVFEGEIEVLRADECLRLPADGYALIPYATSHAIRNRGTRTARWFELLSPQPKPSVAFVDTFFTGNAASAALMIATCGSEQRQAMNGHSDQIGNSRCNLFGE
jgi:hypothetical protein